MANPQVANGEAAKVGLHPGGGRGTSDVSRILLANLQVANGEAAEKYGKRRRESSHITKINKKRANEPSSTNSSKRQKENKKKKREGKMPKS